MLKPPPLAECASALLGKPVMAMLLRSGQRYKLLWIRGTNAVVRTLEGPILRSWANDA